MACDHGGRTELATRVSGVETAGRLPGSLAAALQTGSPCAGFGLVSPGPAPAAGDVDASDVVIWRRHYGSTL